MIFVLPFLSFFFLLIYVVTMSFQFNSSLVTFNMLVNDELSMFMVIMTCIVLYSSYLVSMNFLSVSLVFVLSFMLVFCLVVFSVSNLFILYFFYEASLVPILYIIMKWGSYPERSLSSIMLLLYTSVFTLPLLFFIFYCFNYYHSLDYSLLLLISKESSFVLSLFVFLSFSVKLPIYGLHFWLPMAHVEAPTFGSMILAGVLLKLGGVGLIRFSIFLDFSSLKLFLYSYFLVFLVYSTLICCFQSDFKRLVAYSSVSHMMTLPLMFFSNSMVGLKGVILLMLFHGLSSPLMFLLVGCLYSFYSSRQLLLMRGLIVSSPLMSFLVVLSFFFTLSAPPFPSFLSEVFFSLSVVSVWFYSSLFLFIFFFLSIVYNLLWLTSITFLNQESSFNYSYLFYYNFFLVVLFLLVFTPFLFTVLFFYI